LEFPAPSDAGSFAHIEIFLKMSLEGGQNRLKMMYNQSIQKEAALPETKITAAGMAML